MNDDDTELALLRRKKMAQLIKREKELQQTKERQEKVDAERMKLRQDDMVKVVSRRGEMTAKTMVTDRVGEGVVFMPFHFVESNANALTNTAFDPICKIPELKVCAVKLEKAA